VSGCHIRVRPPQPHLATPMLTPFCNSRRAEPPTGRHAQDHPRSRPQHRRPHLQPTDLSRHERWRHDLHLARRKTRERPRPRPPIYLLRPEMDRRQDHRSRHLPHRHLHQRPASNLSLRPQQLAGQGLGLPSSIRKRHSQHLPPDAPLLRPHLPRPLARVLALGCLQGAQHLLHPFRKRGKIVRSAGRQGVGTNGSSSRHLVGEGLDGSSSLQLRRSQHKVWQPASATAAAAATSATVHGHLEGEQWKQSLPHRLCTSTSATNLNLLVTARILKQNLTAQHFMSSFARLELFGETGSLSTKQAYFEEFSQCLWSILVRKKGKDVFQIAQDRSDTLLRKSRVFCL
jgi:hypothetical protein